VGTSAVGVTLNYNTLGDYNGNNGVANLSDLRVARYDNGDSEWKDEGNAGTTGNTTLGTVTSPPLNEFSPFTLGFATYPLPVELISFDVSAIGNQANIKWETSSEVNNNHFILQRTLDGDNVIDIARIPSKAEGGNSTERLKYSYSELIDYSNVAYYRLVQVDHDGTSKIYPYEALDVYPSQKSLPIKANVYPNPVKESFFTLEFAHEGELDFKFISIDGKQVYSLNAIKLDNHRYRLRFMDQVVKGLYLLNIRDLRSGKHLESKRVLVQ
jgi:hypothetical protein